MKPDEVFGLENAGWSALLVNEAGTIVRANQAAVKMFGSALERDATSLSGIWAPENTVAAEQFLGQWERSPTSMATLKFRIKGGTTSSYPVTICSYVRDGQRSFVFQFPPDSVRVSAAESAAQKQKLDCALQLARTVSLDFNNALTTVLGYTSLVLAQMEPDNQWRKLLLEVEKSASRAAEISNDLGVFSLQEKETKNQSNGHLNTILQRSVEVFRNVDTKEISWTLEFERKMFGTRLDEAKIQQAFVNIIENAVQALEQGGRIGIQTRNVELAEAAQDCELHLAPGTYVCVEIADNGCGIAPEVMPRVFEPFFTTQKEGHRGLGLALVYGIVTNHGGGVAISSEPGMGTSVRVYLPAESQIVYDTSFTYKDLHGTQTILMVDDEDLVLGMGQTILASYGYQVLTMNSGQKALEFLTQSQAPKVDLLITDLVMPSMSGRELAEHVRLLFPQLPILFSSGYVRSQFPENEFPYLHKPFTTEEMLGRVKSVLAGNIS
jgi:signal transduction histidine kinase/CheY-like chemotaxis protein